MRPKLSQEKQLACKPGMPRRITPKVKHKKQQTDSEEEIEYRILTIRHDAEIFNDRTREVIDDLNATSLSKIGEGVQLRAVDSRFFEWE